METVVVAMKIQRAMKSRAFKKTFKSTLFSFVFIFTLLGCTARKQTSLFQEAETYLTEGKYTEAASLLQKAVALDPESEAGIRGLYKLGSVSEGYLRDYESALQNYLEYNRLIRDDVSRYEVLKKVANLYFEHLSQPEKAAEAYAQILSLTPDTLERDFLRLRLGQSYFRMNAFEKSRHEYQKLIDEVPKSPFVPRARYEIGNTYYMEARYEVALEALKQVLRNHSGSEYALESQVLMAQCYEHMDKLADALAIYQSVKDTYSSKRVIELKIGALQKRLKKG